MDFASSLYEIGELEKEIKNLNVVLKKHRDRKKVLVGNILDYLLQNDKKEVQVNGKIVKLEEYIRKSRKKEVDKKNDVINVIKEHINPEVNPEDLYKEIKNSLQGQEKVEYKIEI